MYVDTDAHTHTHTHTHTYTHTRTHKHMHINRYSAPSKQRGCRGRSEWASITGASKSYVACSSHSWLICLIRDSFMLFVSYSIQHASIKGASRWFVTVSSHSWLINHALIWVDGTYRRCFLMICEHIISIVTHSSKPRFMWVKKHVSQVLLDDLWLPSHSWLLNLIRDSLI